MNHGLLSRLQKHVLVCDGAMGTMLYGGGVSLGRSPPELTAGGVRDDMPDPAELRGFCDQVLGTLLAYDRDQQADLVRTLSAYLRHHGSLQSAARELFVHVNTVS